MQSWVKGHKALRKQQQDEEERQRELAAFAGNEADEAAAGHGGDHDMSGGTHTHQRCNQQDQRDEFFNTA